MEGRSKRRKGTKIESFWEMEKTTKNDYKVDERLTEKVLQGRDAKR